MTNSVVIIAGPTAVGKTALAIDLASRLHTSIISADSRQCFQQLNIGVAKPTEAQLQCTQHYFINSHSIDQEVNAGIFEKYALAAADTIFQQNNIAIMVGGTGLYIKAFAEGIDEMPEVPAHIREDIINNYQTLGLEWLQGTIKEKDPFFWQTAEQQNPQRLMRALEIINTTGQSINNYRRNQPVSRTFNIIKIAIELPREKLVENIDARVDSMMADGLQKEAECLLPYQHLNALQTVGYKELFDYFNGQTTLKQAINQIKINTRQYAKRQMTWFKKDKEYKWFANDRNLLEDVLGHINQQVNF